MFAMFLMSFSFNQVWDRLPMTLGFMAIYSVVLHERLQLHRLSEYSLDIIAYSSDWLSRLGVLDHAAAVNLLSVHIEPRLPAFVAALPAALAVIGVLSVFYWHLTDDLRPYFIVQFYPLVTIPLLMHFFDPVFSHAHHLVAALGWYGLAKVAEVADRPIYRLTCGMSSEFVVIALSKLLI